LLGGFLASDVVLVEVTLGWEAVLWDTSSRFGVKGDCVITGVEKSSIIIKFCVPEGNCVSGLKAQEQQFIKEAHFTYYALGQTRSC